MIGLKIAEGREAEVYAWSGDAAAVLKLYRPGYRGHIAESVALTRLVSMERPAHTAAPVGDLSWVIHSGAEGATPEGSRPL
jgi:hypothetical protein